MYLYTCICKKYYHANVLVSNGPCVGLFYTILMNACIFLCCKIKIRVLLIINMLVKIPTIVSIYPLLEMSIHSLKQLEFLNHG